MDIQATISKLQSDIKRRAWLITALTKCSESALEHAKNVKDDKYIWRSYHNYKSDVEFHALEQKIDKSLYKLMCKIQNQMPNGSISMAQIREI